MTLPRRLVALLVILVAAVAFAVPAEAHRLKLFVSVEGMTVSGYAFFIGGGRPQDVAFVVEDAGGTEVHRGRTDTEGAFSWTAAKPADYVLSIDTGDGHFAREKIPADRFSPDAAAALAAPVDPSTPAAAAFAQGTIAAPATALACPAPLDPARLERLVESAVDRAVARQLRPLVEAQTLAEGRLRFDDVMGGVGMIVGLAGLAAWGLARRRSGGGRDA